MENWKKYLEEEQIEEGIASKIAMGAALIGSMLGISPDANASIQISKDTIEAAGNIPIADAAGNMNSSAAAFTYGLISSVDEPQAQEESANNTEEDGGDTEETKQNVEEVKSEETEDEGAEESQNEDSAEPIPEEESTEEVDEIDEIKPHSDVKSDEMQQPSILPEDSRVVSPEGPRQI